MFDRGLLPISKNPCNIVYCGEPIYELKIQVILFVMPRYGMNMVEACHGYEKDTDLYIESEISVIIQPDTLLSLKYLGMLVTALNIYFKSSCGS